MPAFFDATRGAIAFCNMCLERVQAGRLPACVKTCPSGAMNFGGRQVILKLTNKRLAEGRAAGQEACLTDPDSTRVIFLLIRDSKKHQDFAVANRQPGE